MKIVPYQRTPCPTCGSTRAVVQGTRREGTVIVRYHLCECGEAFRSHEDAPPPTSRRPRRKAKVPRK